MKSMLKLMIVLALTFASTFLILKLTGVLSVDQIKLWLEMAKEMSPYIIGIVVAFLLFADLFVAMPTLTIMLLAGFFLGPVAGAISVITGLSLAGFSGYFLSARFGDRILKILIRDVSERQDAIDSFRRHGIIMILLSRAAPILPEVSACMAGLTRMPLYRFAPAWLCSTVPYAIIASYAGSISSLSNPQPAIYAAIGLTGVIMLVWFVFRRYGLNRSSRILSEYVVD